MPEVVEVMDIITVALQDFDFIVQSLAGSVGSATLPAVLDVGAAVPDRVGALPPGALMSRGGISVKSVGEHAPLYGISRFCQDVMEFHEGHIGFSEVIGKSKSLFQQRGFKRERALPVLLLI